jgi:ATP-binding cassette subfamily B protein
MAGLATPSGGTLVINGADATTIDPFVYRGRIAYVPQEPFLFSATVAENIAMGSEGPVSHDQIVTAARLSAVDGDIARFPEGYDTLVGERGITLSGGQRQRVAIARALIRNSDLLIMDDALSSVDSDTETRILTNLSSLKSSRTIVMVSHRVSALQLADSIVVMDGGTVVGSHGELMKTNGRYSKLAKLQQLEAELG